MEQISDAHAKEFVAHYRNLKQIHFDHKIELCSLTELDNQWIWGEAGVGKSRSVREQYPDIYIKMCNKWWDGFENQKTVLLDDFDKNHSVLGHHLKIWSDRYPFRAEVKNHSALYRPERIIVTSNYHPKDIWPTDPELVKALLRRFKVVEMLSIKEVDDLPTLKKPVLKRNEEHIVDSKKTKRHDLPYLTVKKFKSDKKGNIITNKTVQPKLGQSGGGRDSIIQESVTKDNPLKV